MILQRLRTVGSSAAALACAQSILSAAQSGRTRDPAVVEPVAMKQLTNPYFALLATEGARCEQFRYSHHPEVNAKLVVTNPVMLQCPICRYSLCRSCLDPQDLRCPEAGCGGDLGVPVLPTGRPRGLPASRFTEKLEHVLLHWRDMPVDQTDIDDLLDLACTWQDRRGITVRSHASSAGKQDGSDLERHIGWTTVALLEREGHISAGGLYRTRVVPIESRGRQGGAAT